MFYLIVLRIVLTNDQFYCLFWYNSGTNGDFPLIRQVGAIYISVAVHLQGRDFRWEPFFIIFIISVWDHLHVVAIP